MSKINLCVLFGGRSSEYEVSLRSACSVLSEASKDRYHVIPVGITKEGAWYYFDGAYASIADGSWCDALNTLPRVTFSLAPGERTLYLLSPDGTVTTQAVDVIFPVLHGAYGEDGRIQGLLAAADIPFVGCDSESSAMSMDKAVTKCIVEKENIRQAACVILRRAETVGHENKAADAAEEKLGYPIFVKPARAGSSVGVSKAKDRASLLAAMEIAFREDDKILCEEAIVGAEVEVAVLEENGVYTVSECAEIVAGVEFYDYEAKYLSNTSSFHIPARISDASRAQARKNAERIFRVLGCRGLSRVDFFVTPAGEVIFNEINTLPGFTPISMYPKLMMHTGMTYAALIDRLVDAAMA